MKKYSTDELNKMKVDKLRPLASALKIPKYKSLNKPELIKAIFDNQEDGVPETEEEEAKKATETPPPSKIYAPGKHPQTGEKFTLKDAAAEACADCGIEFPRVTRGKNKGKAKENKLTLQERFDAYNENREFKGPVKGKKPSGKKQKPVEVKLAAKVAFSRPLPAAKRLNPMTFGKK